MKLSDPLQAYILEYLQQGFDEHVVREQTLKAGWPYVQVEAALKDVAVVRSAIYKQQWIEWIWIMLTLCIALGSAYFSYYYQNHV